MAETIMIQNIKSFAQIEIGAQQWETHKESLAKEGWFALWCADDVRNRETIEQPQKRPVGRPPKTSIE